MLKEGKRWSNKYEENSKKKQVRKQKWEELERRKVQVMSRGSKLLMAKVTQQHGSL